MRESEELVNHIIIICVTRLLGILSRVEGPILLGVIQMQNKELVPAPNEI